MSRSFLIVLPKEMRSGVAPASSASSISTTEAVSKHEPSSARSLSTCRLRIRLHGVEHARVGERPGELGVVVAHDVEVDDHAGAVLASVAQEFTDALRHGALPTKGSMEVLCSLRIESSDDRKPAVRRQRGRRHLRSRAMETREAAMGSSPDDAALDWKGETPCPHARQ